MSHDETTGSCVLASETTLENGRLARGREHPAFLIDATGTNTANRFRMIYCTTYFDGHIYPVAFGFAPTESTESCAMLVSALVSTKVFENKEDIAVITGAGDGVNSAVDNQLDQCQRGHCYSHLMNTDLWKNKGKFTSNEHYQMFAADIRRNARCFYVRHSKITCYLAGPGVSSWRTLDGKC